MALADRVPVNFESVPAIFQVVAVAFYLRGQFLRLAYGHEARAKVVSQDRGENETARLDAYYAINISSIEMFDRPVDDGAQSFCVFEHSGDVVEEYAWFWEIGDFADQFFKL